jgi:Fe-S-cluster containining protein
MEFTVDAPLIASITTDELAQTRADLAELGALGALARSQERHDARLAAAGDATSLACKTGCFWCCYFTVEVRPIEVLRILDFMQQTLSEAERERIAADVLTNSAALAQLDEEARLRHNMKCPLLSCGRCSIYAARPQTCRNYHATSAAGCQQAYEEPDNDDIDPEFAPLTYQSGRAHVDAFSTALQQAGYDVAAYELNAALAVALADPAGTRARFAAHEQAFPAIEGAEVPLEFMDVEQT